MDVFVRGARSATQDWALAHKMPLSEIPSLDDKEKTEARRGNISEEEFARIAYAEHLWQQRTLRKILRFGHWLDEKIEERNPECHIEAIQLDTMAGRLQIKVQVGDEIVDFEMDEDLVEQFMTTGSAELEKAIFRLLEVNLPRRRVARAS